jgi:acyl carrier protein
MNDTAGLLKKCFSTVFPQLSAEEIPQASVSTIANWDSMASITLLTLIGEEFGITLNMDDFEQFTSFQSLLEYLRTRQPNA